MWRYTKLLGIDSFPGLWQPAVEVKAVVASAAKKSSKGKAAQKAGPKKMDPKVIKSIIKANAKKKSDKPKNENVCVGKKCTYVRT